MKTSITVNGQMMVADVQKEKKGQYSYHFVASLVGSNGPQGMGDTHEEAADELQAALARKL